jgi:hypothetical protein
VKGEEVSTSEPLVACTTTGVSNMKTGAAVSVTPKTPNGEPAGKTALGLKLAWRPDGRSVVPPLGVSWRSVSTTSSVKPGLLPR